MSEIWHPLDNGPGGASKREMEGAMRTPVNASFGTARRHDLGRRPTPSSAAMFSSDPRLEGAQARRRDDLAQAAQEQWVSDRIAVSYRQSPQSAVFSWVQALWKHFHHAATPRQLDARSRLARGNRAMPESY